MMTATEHIEKAIQDLQGERERIERAITGLQTTLTMMRNGNGASSAQLIVSKAFARKYEQNARELVERVIPERGAPIHIGQVVAALAAQGYIFKRGTVRLAINHLKTDEIIDELDAPKGSGYSYAYRKAPTKEPSRGED